MANIEEFLLEVEKLKKDDENRKLSGREYLTKLDQIIFTYCPRNCYYKGDYLETMLLINNNKMDNIKRIMRKQPAITKIIKRK